MPITNIFGRVQADSPTLSRAFRSIAQFLIAKPQDFIQHPISRLSKAIGISEPTLIRFSRHYGFEGMPDMRLAIAMELASSTSYGYGIDMEPTLSDKEVVNRQAKIAIAHHTADLIKEDQSILLDSGSTVQFLAEHLRTAQPLNIMTTGLALLLKLGECNQHKLMLTGGILRQNAMSLTGRLAEASLTGMSFDTAYIGADSIDPQFGLSTFSEEEAHLNRAMVRACLRTVVMADSSKFISPKLHRICSLSEINVIVSDDKMSSEMQTLIQAQGPKLMLAPLCSQSKASESENYP